ncbi:uromodulin-like [Mercenaria mercenaria]|uniref:uromodulin-like n=1 Tax=Mercenaria mercenaria TaxID=6596 RepID=UPI00234F83AD|nr:uromodulin-like [Mercenaria mercenaria]
MEPMTVNVFLKFVLFGFVLGVSIGSANSSCFDSSTDLCDGVIPDIPYLATRDPTVMVTNVTFNWIFCDVYAINTSMWYKSKTPMSTSCPSMFMCGTKFPIWMDGQNPDTHDGLVNRTSCLRDFDSCCLHTYKLAAINCGEFMAYCFVDLPSNCHQRYCFDVKKSEPNTDITHTPTLLQTEATLSNVSSPKITQPAKATISLPDTDPHQWPPG